MNRGNTATLRNIPMCQNRMCGIQAGALGGPERCMCRSQLLLRPSRRAAWRPPQPLAAPRCFSHTDERILSKGNGLLDGARRNHGNAQTGREDGVQLWSVGRAIPGRKE